MKKNGTKLMMALGLFCLCHVNAADEMDSVGNLHDIFECYSASNWYGKSKKSYSGLVKQWPLSFPAMLRPVYHERAKSSGGTRDVFLLSDAGNTNQLVRLEIVCADSIKLAHRAMLEYFSSCSAVQPFPIASDDTGSVGDYCYFGYGKPWTSVMFVRDNVFVALKSLASMSSVRQEAEAIDKEIMRLASGNYDSGMAAGITEEQKASSLNLSGIVAKTNVVEFLSYQRSIGLTTMQNKLTPNGCSLLDAGLEVMAWVMWQKDIVFPSNDVDCARWRCPADLAVDALRFDVQRLDASRFDMLKDDMVIANCEATVFNTCSEQIESFMYPHAMQFINSNMPLHFRLLNNLEVSYLGAATNMLYITERGSLEDSVTHKNITLKIRYKDDSLAKHRKAIAEALMTAGTVTKFKVPNVPDLLFADDNAANGSEKKNSRENASVKDVRGDGGKVL